MKKSHYSKKMFFRFLLGSTSKEENGVVLSELSKSKESLNSARKSFYGFLHIMSTPADKTWLDANFQKIDRRIKSTVQTLYQTFPYHSIANIFWNLNSETL